MLDLGASFPPLRRYCPNLPTLSDPQALFLLLEAREAFYGGAAGGGKSDALLMAALQHVDVPAYSAIIFRRTYADLALPGAIMDRARTWLAPHDEVKWSEKDKVFRFPSGATLAFGYLQHPGDELRYQGAEFQFVGFDELTQFPEHQYLYLFSRLRRLEAFPVPLRMRSASNPGGVGHAWVKERFLTGRQDGRVFIPAKVSDNPGLDVDEYVESLSNLPDATRAQLLDGDWGAFEGAAYPMFKEELHVVGELPPPPSSWDRFEFMDFGTANPTAWYLAAVDYDGNIVVLDEHYSPGLVSEHAREILDRRSSWWERKDDNGWTIRNRCFCDPAVKNRTGLENRLGEPASVFTEFADLGIALAPANNDRRAGYIRVAELLTPDAERPFPHWHKRYGERGAPRLFVTRRCKHLIEQVHSAPLLALTSGKKDAGEIVDPAWEQPYGHAHAALRYGVMSRPGASTEPETWELDPRKAMIQRRADRRKRIVLPDFVEL